MFNQIKQTIKSEEFRRAVLTATVNVAATVVTGIVIKAAAYAVVEGTKAVITMVKESKETPAE